MSAEVHATAVVEAGAELEDGVVIGPFAVVGASVRVGAGTRVGAHAVLGGECELGRENEIGAHAILGGPPQLRGGGRAGRLVLGDENHVRELVTIHVGGEGGETRLGHRNLLMTASHVAHDCRLGDDNELANGVQLAGHVAVGAGVTFGGLAAVHQYVRVGDCAMIGAGAMVSQDVPPYCSVSGDRARLYGLNTVGLRRRGISADAREEIARAVRSLFAAPTLREGIAQLEPRAENPLVANLLRFAEGSTRGLCRPVEPR